METLQFGLTDKTTWEAYFGEAFLFSPLRYVSPRKWLSYLHILLEHVHPDLPTVCRAYVAGQEPSSHAPFHVMHSQQHHSLVHLVHAKQNSAKELILCQFAQNNHCATTMTTMTTTTTTTTTATTMTRRCHQETIDPASPEIRKVTWGSDRIAYNIHHAEAQLDIVGTIIRRVGFSCPETTPCLSRNGQLIKQLRLIISISISLRGSTCSGKDKKQKTRTHRCCQRRVDRQ